MDEQLDLLMSFAGASPARMLVPQENGADLLAPGQGCGSKCSESCAKCGPLGSLLKTSLALELTALTGCCVTWSAQATPAGRSWWVLMTSDSHTAENVSGLSGDDGPELTARNWVTPTARDWKDTQGQKTCDETHHHCDLLPRQVFALLPDAANSSTGGKHPAPSQLLNADWVQQLMGYPREWARLITGKG